VNRRAILAAAALIIGAGAATAVSGATRGASAQDDDRIRAVDVGEHGVQIGAAVPRTAVTCDDSTTTIGSAPIELITFSTPQDCSACSEHLAGLETLSVHGKLPARDVVVLWAPGEDLERNVAHLRRTMHRKLCIDPPGDLWDRLDVSHTPFTILVRRDTIVYVNDSRLTSPLHAADFLHDVELLSHGGIRR